MVHTLSSVGWKCGLTACARCTKSATAATCASTSGGGKCCISGSASGDSANSYSPWTCSTARLVTNNLSCGQAESSSTSWGAAESTCSKLSSSNKNCLSCRKAVRCSLGCRSPLLCKPSVEATVGITSSGLLMAASGTKQTSWPNACCSSVPNCTASRVLPTPGGPVRVSSRTWGRERSLHTACTSSSRPSSGVRETGICWKEPCEPCRDGPAEAGAASGAAGFCRGESAWLASSRAMAKLSTSTKRCAGSLDNACKTTCSTVGGRSEWCSRKAAGAV